MPLARATATQRESVPDEIRRKMLVAAGHPSTCTAGVSNSKATIKRLDNLYATKDT